MSRIVAARFDTFESAQVAANALMTAGVSTDSLHTFFVNPSGAHDRYPMGGDRASDPQAQGAPYTAAGGAAILGVVGAIIGAVIGYTVGGGLLAVAGGAGVGAYVGSFGGAMRSLGGSKGRRTTAESLHAKKHEGRSSGVMLAVHAVEQEEQRIASILRDAGGVEIEQARGQWKDGMWADFDPLVSPDLKTEREIRAPTTTP